jgi:hypothetical protein
LLYPAAIDELEKMIHSDIPALKWERLRFLVLFLGDYTSMSGTRKLMNGDSLDLYTLISMPIGFALSISEWIYGRYHDEGVTIGSATVRRTFKLSTGLGSVFILKNILQGIDNNYAIFDYTYSALSNVFLILTLLELRRLAKKATPPELTATLLTEEEKQEVTDVVVTIPTTPKPG